MTKPTRTIYVPAVSCSGAAYLKMDDKKIHENPNLKKSIRFTNKVNTLGMEPYVYHPYILFTAAYYYKDKDVRKVMQVDKDALVFLDSGGFQLMTGKTHKDFNMKVSLEWCEKNGDIFPILDFPAPRSDSTITKFTTALDASCTAAKFYYENRSVAGKRLLNVVSGSTRNSIDLWYKRISEWKFDGWCHGGHNGGLKSILQTILFLLNKGEFDSDTPIDYHVFGMSTNKMVMYLALIQREINRLPGVNVQILFDSSYFQRTAAFGNLMVGTNRTALEAIKLSNRFDYSNASKEIPSCSPIFLEPLADVDKFFKEPLAIQTMMSLNNLWWVLHNKERMDRLVNCGCDDVMFNGVGKLAETNFRNIIELFKDPKSAEDHLEACIVDVKDGSEPVQTIENFL